MDTKLKVGQFVRESYEWKRTLAFLLQESFFIKLRLADVLNGKEVSADFLETAELYQSRFIRKEETINLLRHEVSELDALLSEEIFKNGIIPEEVVHKQKHLRMQIRFLETEFNKLKLQFNNYLSDFYSKSIK